MPASFPTEGEVYSIRTYKTLVNRPDIVWANSYEVRVGDGAAGVGSILPDAAAELVAWERTFHMNTVRFVRTVLSTWVPDGQPYNPASFVSVDAPPLTLGARVPGDNGVQPLQVCLLATKDVSFGRNGRNLYRGALSEDDVVTSAGEATLTAAGLAQLNTLFAADGGIASLLAQNANLEMIMKGSSAQDAVRPVRAVTPRRVVIKKFNNRYFDRGAQ